MARGIRNEKVRTLVNTQQEAKASSRGGQPSAVVVNQAPLDLEAALNAALEPVGGLAGLIELIKGLQAQADASPHANEDDDGLVAFSAPSLTDE